MEKPLRYYKADRKRIETELILLDDEDLDASHLERNLSDIILGHPQI